MIVGKMKAFTEIFPVPSSVAAVPVTRRAFVASSFPDRNEGIGHLHMSGATSLAIDGHVPFLKFRTFETERNNMPGLLWWYPGSANGQ